MGSESTPIATTQRAAVRSSDTVCREYWGLTGTISPERITRGLRRDGDGNVVEVDIEPVYLLRFDDNEEFRRRVKARGSVGLTEFLALKEHELIFEPYTPQDAGSQTEIAVETEQSVQPGAICYLSGWETEYRCESCRTAMSRRTQMHSGGRCPYCGHKGKGAITIVNCTEHAYRLVRRGRWWQFWIRPVRQYK
jgi:rRNA maturation endonuclease Nob1